MKKMLVPLLIGVVAGLPLIGYIVGSNTIVAAPETLACICAALSALGALLYLTTCRFMSQVSPLRYVVELIVAESWGVGVALGSLIITVYRNTLSLESGAFNNQLVLVASAILFGCGVLTVAYKQGHIKLGFGEMVSMVAGAVITFSVIFNLYYQQLHN